MAMEATHVRFARDLSQHLKIDDWAAYYFGVIYPDSRYVTGVDREKTHGEHCPNDPFAAGLTDFEKGWATHLYYDKTAQPLYFKVLSRPEEKIKQGSDLWQLISAVKVVEDLQGFKNLGSDKNIFLNFSAKNLLVNEDKKLMEKYFSIQKKLYRQQPELTDYRDFWLSFGGNRELLNNIMVFTQKFLADKTMCEKIENIFSTIIQNIQK